MKRIYLLVLLFIVAMSAGLRAQVTVVATAATTGPTVYPDLNSAFAAINAGTHQGVIGIGIGSNTTEAGPCILNSSGAGAAVYTSVTINPLVDGVTVSGATATGRGLIELKGADNVTIDGDNPNTAGINRNLTFTNTAANTVTFTSVIRIATAATVVTSADNITIRNCNINGSATGRNTSGTASTTGSENTTFGIYAGGNGGATATDAPTALTSVTTNTAPAGTTINGFVASNNAVNACARGIAFIGAAAANANSVTISNNLIGDQGTLVGIPPYTTPTTTVYTKGVFVAGATNVTVSGNSIKTILSYVPTGVCGIDIATVVTTPTVSNNTITGVVVNAAAAFFARGISVTAATSPYTVSGNTISNVQNFCSSATNSNQPSGVYVLTTAASGTIEKNNISTVVDRNVGTYGAAGMVLDGGNSITVRNNFISDINQSMTGGIAFSAFGVQGMRVGAGTGHRIYHNSIHLTGTLLGTATTSHLTACLYINATTLTGIDVRNNIFSNQMTGGTTSIAHVSIYLPSAGSAAMGLTLNNNAYFCGTTAASQGIAQVGTTAGTGFYLAGNFNAAATTPANNLRSYTSTLGTATNDNQTFASATVPAFVSTTNLHIPAATATPLESGGATVGITTDIDNDTRPGPVGSVNGGAIAPDMGADEFDGIITDLNAPAITYTPLSITCATTDRTLSGVLITDVSGVPTTGTLVPRIYYKKGVAGVWFSQPGTLASGNATNGTWNFTIVVSDVGGVAIGDQVFYYIIAQDVATTPNISSSPAGAVASNVNTVTTHPSAPNSYTISTTMAGTYTVGIGGSFTTLTAAVNAYNTSCIGGPILFSLIDATYPSETFPIAVLANPYASAVNTLTIKPATGVTPTLTGNNAVAVLRLQGADYITIDGSNTVNGTTRDLTIRNTSTTTSSLVVWLSCTATDGATNNALKNCNVAASGLTTNLAAVISSGTAAGAVAEVANNNNSYINNSISSSFYGLGVVGPGTGESGTVISQNNFGSTVAASKIGFQAIFIAQELNIVVTDNIIAGISSTSTNSPNCAGICYAGTSTGGSILRNKMSDIKNTNTGGYGAYGIMLNSSNTIATPATIANNFISDVAGVGWTAIAINDNGYGIAVNAGAGYNLYYNTVVLNTNQNATSQTAALWISNLVTTPGALDVRNNILTNALTVGSATGRYAIYCAGTSNNIFSNINYNDYTTLATNLGSLNAVNYATLANLQAGFGSNLNSISVAPVITGPGDLHLPQASNLNIEDRGTPLAGVTTDIDGQLRSTCTPDIGADEFGTPREINVQGNSVTIADGNTSISTGNFTDFGTQSVCNGTVTQTFVIQNTGTTALTITGANISGANAADFTITTAPAASVAASGSTTVVVTFDPSAAGARAATLNILSNDCDEATYDFAIGGTGTQVTASIASQTNVSCNGGNNGSATISVTGGVAPITYAWSSSANTTATESGLSAGSYTVTVTDANGCTSVVTVTITEPVVLSAVTSQTNVTCFGTNNGTASVVVSGGTGTYTYDWAPGNPTGDGTNAVSGLPAGSHTVTITDANNCFTTAVVTITAPPAITVMPVSQTDVTCNGGNNGAASVTASGGTGTLTYNWTPGNPAGDGTNSVVGLTAGSWTVTVMDANLCTANFIFTITSPPAIVVTPVSQTNVACNGGNTGAASVSATGGTGTLAYNWTPGNPAGDGTNSVTGLTAGSWTVTVTDANLCSSTAIFNITAPPALVVTPVSQTNVACNGGSTGAASVSATGGTGTLTYNWTPGNPTGDGTNSVTGLTAGVWTVTVTDANACTSTATFNITAPPALVVTPASQTNVSCNGGNNGAASVTATGGTGTLTYNWTPGNPTGDGTNSVTALTAGVWTVTVTDANSCVTTATFNITAPPSIVVTPASQTNVSCNGGNNGAASVTATGGTGTLTYNWTPGNPTGDGTNSVTGLTAGVWTVTVTDANSCTATRTFNITAPPAIVVTPASQTNVACNGGSTGAASVTATGGTGTLTYNWTPGNPTGDGTNSVTGLTAGTWTVTVTDANACTATATFNITAPPALVVTPVSQTNVACFGGSTGAASVTATGGTGTLVYNWTPGNPTGDGTNSVTGLTAGTWTVTVTDANACASTATFTITQPPVISGTITAVTDATCGSNNGSLTVTATGGTGTLTYAWAPAGGNAATASSLTAGSYTVTITDASGCFITVSGTVNNIGGAVVTPVSQTNVSCFGGSNGAASVNATGGTGTLVYNWTPGNPTGDGTNSVTGLTAGTWTVTVTDANLCSSTATFNITQPPAIVVTPVSQTNVSCNGGSNGAASVTATGGTGTLTYNWTPGNPTGDGTNAVTGLTAGTWTVTVTDANACTSIATFSITAPPAIVVTPASQTNVSCFGGSNGAASVTATGGTGTLTYNWTPGNPTGDGTNAVTGLTAGAWTVTVTDANSCTATATFNITAPPALVVTPASQTNVSCNGGNNGAASVTATGGTGTFTYNWTPGNPTGDGTNSVTGLTAGTWTVTVTDANSCTATATFNITAPPAIVVTPASQTNVSCNGGSNGAASVTATGGTGTLTYNWTPGNPTGDGTNSVTGLTAGTWTVTVTDANSCTATATFNITAPPAIVVTPASQTNVSCNGGSNGAASVTATGGTGTLTYNWTPGNPTGDGTNSVTGLTAGTWTVTVTDANSCTATATFNITAPPAIVVTPASQTNVSCNGGNNGAASVTAVGGTGTLTYNWTPGNPTGDGTNSVTGLTAGTWTVTVTDANSCTATATFNITAPPAIVVTPVAQTNVSCFGGSNGAASVTATGGTGTLTYNWTPGNPTGDGTNSVTGLTAGVWTVTVTDANSCTATRTFNITAPPAIVVTPASQTNVSCNGGSNGAASVTATGGTGTLTYNWTPGNPTGDGTNSVTGLTAGTWTVTVTDANTCTATATFNITAPPAIVVTPASQTNVSCNGGSNGAASVTATGGTGTLTYNWTPGNPTGDGTNSVTGLTAGTWTVTVTDANSCTATATFNITAPPAIVVTPASQTNVSCNGGNNGAASVTAVGGTGTLTYNWTPGNPTGDGTNSVTALTAGVWTVTVTDANGCTGTASFNITQAPVIVSSVTAQTNVTCFGGNNGAATIAASGGTGTLTYAWAPSGGNAASATGLTAGIYTVTITDANTCTRTQTVNITQPPVITATISSVTPATCGNSNGSATVVASGGTGTLTYAWAPTGGNAATATGLLAGAYTVTVTDASGCSVTANASVNNIGGPVVTTVSQTNVSCNGGTNGAATILATGGTGQLVYNWTPGNPTGDGTPSVTGLNAAVWSVTVTDANGCVGTQTVTITEPPAITSFVSTQTNVSCNGGSNGSATVTSTGGTGTLSYVWSSGSMTASETGLAAGSYTVTITDANGCSHLQIVAITQPPVITAAISGSSSVTCFGGNNGSATVAASGGTGTLSYAWMPFGGTNATATGLSANTYTVTITDVNGCSTTQTVMITEPIQVVVDANASATFVCAGTAVTLTGSGAATSYTWDNAVTDGVPFTPTASQLYTVTGTDFNGCQNTDTISVIVNALPTVTANASSTLVCSGSPVTLTGSGSATSFTWSGGVQDGVPFASTVTTTYTVTGTDAIGCSDTASVLVSVNPSPVVALGPDQALCSGTVTLDAQNPGDVYMWSDSTSAQTLTATVTGTYWVDVTNASGCTTRDSIEITINPNPVVALGADIVQCGDSVTLDAGNAGATYLWSDSTTNQTLTTTVSGTYYVTATFVGGCNASDTIVVTINPAATVNLGVDSTQCGGSITLDAQNAGDTYVWSDNTTNQTLTATTSGVYWVDVTNAFGCTTRDSVMITINTPPVVNLGADISQCGGTTVLDAGANANTAYVWNDNTTNQTLPVSASGFYYVTATDSVTGCVSSDSINVAINTAPTVTMTVADTVCDNGGTITLIGSPAGGTFFGIGVNGTTFDPSFAGPGSTTLSYSYTDPNGCSANATQNVFVDDCSGILENGTANTISVYPNPNDGHFTITITQLNGEGVLEITDALGQLISAETLASTNGTVTKEINLDVYANGIYFVRFTTNAATNVQKVNVQR